MPPTPNGNTSHLLTGSLWKALLRLTGPMLASAVLQNAQTLIGLFWVGRLGSDSVAALAMSGTIMMMLFPIVMGLATGTVAFVSRAVGAGRYEEASHAAAQSLLLAVLFGFVAGAVGWEMAGAACRLLGGSPEVVRLATQYLRIVFLGSMTVFVLFTCNSVLQAAGNTITPMYAMATASVLNLIMDPIFIFGLLGVPRLGVRGAAVAVVLAQGVAAGVVLLRLSRGVAGIRVHVRNWRWDSALVWKLFSIGMPSSGQMVSRSLMSLALMRIVSGCGTAAVAAYGIGLGLHQLVLFPAFALGNAAATMVGQNLGAHQPRRAAAAAWLAAVTDMGLMVLSALIMVPLAPHLVGLFTKHADVIAAGAGYLRAVSPSYIFAALAIVLGRSLQGAGSTMPPMVLTILCLWGVQVPLAALLSRHVHPATLGIWLAIAAAQVAHGLLTTAWFQTGRWKTKRM